MDWRLSASTGIKNLCFRQKALTKEEATAEQLQLCNSSDIPRVCLLPPCHQSCKISSTSKISYSQNRLVRPEQNFNRIIDTCSIVKHQGSHICICIIHTCIMYICIRVKVCTCMTNMPHHEYMHHTHACQDHRWFVRPSFRDKIAASWIYASHTHAAQSSLKDHRCMHHTLMHH